MNRPTRDSVAGRAYLDLQNQARRQQRTTQELLTLYVLERWLARMSRSSYADDFILKGRMLLAAFGTRRPTVDADTLAQNMASDHETVAQRVSEIATMKDPSDGVTFLIETITIKEIRQEALYAGVRVTMVAQLASAEVKLRLDINFGDPVTPAPRSIELPALRAGFESIHILGYPIETVLAEKVVTALELGLANTRVRDFADIYLLSRTQTLKFDTLYATRLWPRPNSVAPASGLCPLPLRDSGNSAIPPTLLFGRVSVSAEKTFLKDSPMQLSTWRTLSTPCSPVWIRMPFGALLIKGGNQADGGRQQQKILSPRPTS